MKNKYIETDDRWITITDDRRNFSRTQRDHSKELPSLKARMAIDMVTRWGAVAVTPDGEDSSGRSKLALIAPSDLVQRAIETADLMIDEIRARGWMDQMPHPTELYEDEDEAD